MIQKDKLWGIVVWYNPTPANIEAAKSYIDDVNELIIIDNSPVDNSALLKNFSSNTDIHYVPNMGNKGIATALNQGCELAIERGAEWVLTMDQDSHFNQHGVTDLVQKANSYKNFSKTAVFSPLHHYDNEVKNKRKWKGDYTEEPSVMTSGNLLSLEAYKLIGRFRDEFFIDLVDDEFCYRANEKGFLVVMINTVLLNHYLGDACVPVKILGIKMKKTYDDHNPVRRYYIARNTLYMAKLYPRYEKKFKRRIRKQFKRVILYDNSKKWLKLRLMIKGVKDYLCGTQGPLVTKLPLK